MVSCSLRLRLLCSISFFYLDRRALFLILRSRHASGAGQRYEALTGLLSTSFLGHQRQQQEWWTGGGSAEDPSASFRSPPPLARDLLTPLEVPDQLVRIFVLTEKLFCSQTHIVHCSPCVRAQGPPHSRLTHQMSASAVAAIGFESCTSTLTASAPRVTDTCGVSAQPRFGAVGRTRERDQNLSNGQGLLRFAP